ncbi:MAG: hypothetical protein RLZ48_495 [Actinomycetota bacterium]
MRRLLVFLVALVGAVSMGSSGALAEGSNSLESSSPTANEVITVAPTQLQLKFVAPAGTAEQIAQMGLALTCSGRLIGLGTPQLGADGVTVSAALTQVLNNGSCTVSWKLADGSVGSFNFESQTQPTTTTIAGSTPGQTTVPGQTVAPTGKAEARLGGPIGLARWLAFFAVSALFGGLLFIRFVWVEGVEYGITERYFRIVAVAGVLSMALLVSLTTAAESSRSLGGSFLPTSWFSLLDTNEGRALILRIVAVGMLAYFAWIPARIFEPTNVPFTAGAFIGLALSYGFDRASGRMLIIGFVMAILHMAFTMLLVGSLTLVWRVVLFGPGDTDLVHALKGWARVATLLTIGIVVTGLVQVYRLDGFSIINSGHGRMILLKVLVVAAMVVVGNAVRQFVLRGMTRARSLNQKVVWRLKGPVGIELALSVAVLACSSMLMAMRPPYVVARDKGPKVQYAIVQDLVGKDEFHVRVSLTPGNVGNNKLLVELFGPKRIQNFTVSLMPTNPSFSGIKVFVPITRPGGAVLNEDLGMKLLAPGDWTMTVEGTTTTGDLVPLKGTFVIADGVTVTTLPNKNLTATTTTVPVDTTTTTVPQG